jgi:hypothetical protein
MIIRVFFSFYDLGCISSAPHGLVTSHGLGAGEIKPFKLRRQRTEATSTSCALLSPDMEQRAAALFKYYYYTPTDPS